MLIIAVSCCGRARFPDGLCSIGSEEFNHPMDYWSDLYKKRFPGRKPPVHEDKGNGVAPRVLLGGVCDLAVMTRPMTNPEIQALVEKYGERPLTVPVAVEALTIIVPRRLPVRRISMKQIRAVFGKSPPTLGDVFAGLDARTAGAPLRAYGLNSAGDRYRWFKDTVLGGQDFSDRVLEMSGPLLLVDRVGRSRAGFGYARTAEISEGVRALAIELADGRTVSADAKTAASGAYPIARFYHIYLPPPARAISRATADFMRLVLSPEGQGMLTPLGLYPLSAADRLKSLKVLERAKIAGENKKAINAPANRKATNVGKTSKR